MIRILLVAGAVSIAAATASAALRGAVTAEPADLTNHTELLGKEVSVDGRVRLFQLHQDRGIDEVLLKGTDVIFRLPPRLRFRRSPDAVAVRLQGVLKQSGDQWYCDVTELELFPSDLERLNSGVSVLPPAEYQRRNAWALWASKRAREYNDKDLLQRALALEDEAIRLEADQPAAKNSESWLALARRARDHKLPEPAAAALAHRAFRRRFDEAKTLVQLQALASEIAGFFPAASNAKPESNLADWEPRYANDPAGAYRAAPSPIRAALDRSLWADATQKVLERQAAADPNNALDFAGQAAVQLPERPEVARRLLENGMKSAALKVSTLRLREVQSLAKLYRERLNQPESARNLLRDWLDDQRRHRLSASDAEGRILLAAQYEELIGDRGTAIGLLREAWKLDPSSKEVADAFRRRDFRKVRDEWVEMSRARSTEDPQGQGDLAVVPTRNSSKLRGKTPKQVRDLLGGEPNRIVYSASQGQLIEQWIYHGTVQNQYINFSRGSSDAVPTAISSFFVSRGGSSSASH